jgi:LuxR family maltose regulon positive regulatory protein
MLPQESILDSNLLSTKLFIPEPRQDYIIRPKLLDLLDGAISSKLILVAAPPGYGKTTLLSVWIKERDFPTAWLSIDPEDNDSSSFLRYLIEALHSISPKIGQVSLALLKSSQTSSAQEVLTALLNDLTQIEQDSTLVLDDYHSIENQEVHDHLTYLLDHLPPRMHIVIASRSDPPLPISRLRSRNQLLEIRQADLRLSPEEADQFLQKTMGVDLSKEQVTQLESRTEGWFAGLQFAGLSMSRQEDYGTFLNSFSGSHRYIIDYLADEVYNNQSKDMQVFLSKIAILDRFTAPLCDAITGRQDSQIMLSQLDESNLFLIALDEQRKWYRFHHLFLDSLRVYLQDQPQAELHRLAAGWFLENKLYVEAVKHASASGDKDLLIAAISSAAKIAFEQGEIAPLSSWLNSLPQRDLLDNSQLATFKGMITFFSENPEEALPYVMAAQANQPKNAPSSQRGQLMCLQAHIGLYQGDINRSISLSREALEYLDPDDLFFRNLALNVLGQILEMKSDVSGAVEIYWQAFILSQKTEDRLGTLVIFTNLILALNELGKRTQALDLCQEFVADPKWRSTPGIDLSDGVYLTWSLLSYEGDQLEIANEQVERALHGLERVNIAQGKLWAQFILGSIHLANQEFEQLAEVTAQGKLLAGRSGSEAVHYGWFDMLDAQANLVQGDLAAVTRWAKSKTFSPQDIPHHWFEQQYFTYIRLLIAQDKFVEARFLLESMLANAQAGKRHRKLITIHLLMSLIESAANQQEKVIENLERALDLAVPQDYRRAFLNEGDALLELLPAVRNHAPAFINQLLSVKDPSRVSGPEFPHPYQALSERELEVLRLVARGYSNRQIADTLFVTLGTVKKHINNIFGKLQVKNRTESVVRARELQILD